MLNWLKKRLTAGINKISQLAHAALDAVAATWNVFTSFLHMMRVVVADFIASLVGFLHMAQNFALWATRGLVDIIRNRIPRAFSHALNTAVEWARRFAAGAVATARGLFSTVLDWVARNLAAVRGALTAARDYLLKLISPVVAWLSRIGNRVADIVLHPDRLAAWLLPALWAPLWRYLRSREVAVARWVLRSSVGAVVASAGAVESVLAKIL